MRGLVDKGLEGWRGGGVEGWDGSGSRRWVVGLGRGSGVPKEGFEAGAEVGGGRRGAKADSDAQG